MEGLVGRSVGRSVCLSACLSAIQLEGEGVVKSIGWLVTQMVSWTPRCCGLHLTE